MKILEPFSGYKLASGHAYFHLAYFCASFSVSINHTVDYKGSVPSEAFYSAFYVVRWVHLAVFVLSFPNFFANQANTKSIAVMAEDRFDKASIEKFRNNGWAMFSKFTEVLQVFAY